MARRFDRLGWAMDQPDLTPTQRFVLLILADMANEVGECWPKKATISARTGFSRATVTRTLTELREEQVLVTESRTDSRNRQTSNLYRLCLLGRGLTVSPPNEDDDEDVDPVQESPRGLTTSRREAHSEPHVEPPTRTSRKNNSTATQQSGSSRHASRARDDSGWNDPAAEVFAKQQDETVDVSVPEPKSMRRNPDSAWALNGYYRQHVFVAGQGRVGNTNDGAMRKFFAEARRCGVTADVLRLMVDCFVEDPQLFDRAKGHRWKVFIANAPLLQERAERVATTARIMDPEAEVPSEFGGAIPQAVLDKILAEAV